MNQFHMEWRIVYRDQGRRAVRQFNNADEFEAWLKHQPQRVTYERVESRVTTDWTIEDIDTDPIQKKT